MPYQENRLSASAIKYLLAISGLCKDGKGVRCVDVSTELNVTKPSAHHMIQSLCDAGLAERERYGAVYLTDEGKQAFDAMGQHDLAAVCIVSEGREAAALYRTCYDALFIQIKKVVSVDDTACRNAACAALEQVADQMPQLAAQKGAQND